MSAELSIAQPGVLAGAVDANRGNESFPEKTACFHCGTACRTRIYTAQEKNFCCRGCLTVFEILTENGLTDYYELSRKAGIRIKKRARKQQFAYLDEPGVRESLVDFTDERNTRVTFYIPAIHCIACVWLLENLFRLKPGIGRSQVNFPRKEVSINFETGAVKLSEIAALLTSLGYEPELKLADTTQPEVSPATKRLWLQLGVAGFAFGNTMLFSIAGYLGLDSFSGPAFKTLTGYISFLLALPVLFYSAQDYFRLAWIGLQQRLLTIEVPIAAGIIAIFGQSTYEVLTGAGEGYFDSFSGLLFFLLCGRLFQQKTYDRLVFDRDYKSFFPLSVTRKSQGGEETIGLASLGVGDRIVLRNGELIPADARLVKGEAHIDYSFVTGESEPVEKAARDHLYAGGRQMGGAIELEIVKPVSQSYLASLWNQEAFAKDPKDTLDTLINRYSERFTLIVLAIALGSAAVWGMVNPARSLNAFIGVLIVACPCALALAAPFSLGAAVRALGRRNIFLKNAQVVETLAKIDSVVFDKTGTLTGVGAGSVRFEGEPLSQDEITMIQSVAAHSAHPYACRIAEALAGTDEAEVRSFREIAGRGMEGCVNGQEVVMGSAAWLKTRGISVPSAEVKGSTVHLSIGNQWKGVFHVGSALRMNAGKLLAGLSRQYEVSLLSGDNERERERFAGLFGKDAHLKFNQSPMEKLEFVRERQEAGRKVMMVGDGLNDAGALKQSDVGVAVVENISAFSPASDVILSAGMVPRISDLLRFAKGAVGVVNASFVISAAYNVIGIGIAASGRLSPIVCAILMPLSSITVVAFATGITNWLGSRVFEPTGGGP